MHVTTEMAAEFYQVDIDAVRQLVARNREEFDDDGYRVVTRSVFESDIASLSNVDPRARQIALFPRRAVLRIGMLLRGSGCAVGPPCCTACVSRLLDEELHPVLVVETPQEATASRLNVSRTIAEIKGQPGFRLPVSKYERDLYIAAGLEPPTE
ncbi:hypothetical protein M2284_002662 [Rhodococcus sp. LBL1]|nr:hypothetical protein [Rhodococcus sp. LBL1]MDH6684046.1 hypothetical protein [Rhodococcus sp. LBL2]